MPCGSASLATYDPNIGDSMVLLNRESVQVQLEDRPFAKGGCREAFVCRIADSSSGFAFGKKLVAKRYLRKDEFLEDYICAHMAQSYAKKFNEKNPYKKIRFLVPNKIMTFNGVKYSLEEFLEGRWQKHNNIFGMMESNHTTPSAFSHFTYQASGQKLMILDVQGVGDTYTDPAIVSTIQGKYGYTDTGMTGITAFLRNHSCGQVCNAVFGNHNGHSGQQRRRSADHRSPTPMAPLPMPLFPSSSIPPPALSNRPSNLIVAPHSSSSNNTGGLLGGFSSGAFQKPLGGLHPQLPLPSSGAFPAKQLVSSPLGSFPGFPHVVKSDGGFSGVSTTPSNFGMLISV